MKTTVSMQPEGEPELAVLDSDRHDGLFAVHSLPVGDRPDDLPRGTRLVVTGRGGGNRSEQATSSVSLRVEPRRARLAASTIAVIALIVTLTLIFTRGVELTQFPSRDKDEAARTKLLNEYNAYSGSVAAAFSAPLELFVALAVQLVVLRFTAASLARPPSWHVALASLALGGAVAYLLSNSLNALNVQLRALPVSPAIGASDLAVPLAFVPDSPEGQRTTTVVQSVPEASPRNLVTNTLLRNLLLPAEPRAETMCSLSTFAVFREHSVQYGFPQREWQRRALPEALEPTQKTLRLVVDATSTTNASASATEDEMGALPMSASRAAHLFVYSMFAAAGEQSLFPWGRTNAFARVSDIKHRVNWTTAFENGSAKYNFNAPTVELTGLLPANHTLRDESEQRAYFLPELREAVRRQFANATNTSRKSVSLEFSHRQITPGIVFDALTIEVEMEPTLLATGTNTVDNTTRYTFVDTNHARGSVAALAMVAKRASYRGKAVAFGDAAVLDAAPQVQAMSACLDAVNGTEILPMVIGTIGDPAKWTTLCPDRSSSSLYVFSVAKRLEADAFLAPTPRTSTAAVKNLRKIFSFTMGRLAWETFDLSETFHATCNFRGGSDGMDRHACHGLTLPLAAPAEQPSRQQQLVVGASALPVAKLPEFSEFRSFRTQMLAEVNEPRQLDADIDPLSGPDPLAGDPLLVHNIAELDWQWSRTTTCSDVTETRLQQVLDNHYYSERSLQPAYTAAMFFLFQNGVVRDVITVREGETTTTSLRFDANAQPIAVWLSVPTQNAWLTLTGCVLLVVALLAALAQSLLMARRANDPLAAITDPHAIARVMLDERRFPPLLLHCRLVHHSLQGDEEGGRDGTLMNGPCPVDGFTIEALSLQQEKRK